MPTRADYEGSNRQEVGRLAKSVLQGLAVFAASFGTYYTVLQMNLQDGAPAARAMGLSVIFLSNLFLVLVNSSYTDFAFRSLSHLVKDRVMWAIFAGTTLGLVLILYTPVSSFLKLAPLSGLQFLAAIGISAVAVLWYELVKLVKYLKRK